MRTIPHVAGSAAGLADERFGLVRWFIGFMRRLRLAIRVARERRQLRTLDDRLLRDVGVSRGDANVEAARGFWEVPVGRERR